MLTSTFYTKSSATQTEPPNDDDLANLWQSILQRLDSCMTRATFDNLLRDSTPVKRNDNKITVAVSSDQAAEWLNGRMSGTVQRTLSDITNQTYEVDFVTRVQSDSPKQAKRQPNNNIAQLSFLPKSTNDVATTANDGYELSPQYFRKVWRPLLGPLLSELIRELRQLGYEQGFTRDCEFAMVEATQMGLAKSLGISRRTLVRALERTDNNQFKQKHLNLFILDLIALKGRDERGRTVKDRTRFKIRLNDPILPELN